MADDKGLFDKEAFQSDSVDKRLMPVGGGPAIEATVVTGARTGPTLVVTAGVHGCEYVGMLAARKLAETLNTKRMSGRVIIFPLLNQWGFFKKMRAVMFEDGKNLNRSFPGDPEGSYSSRLAFEFETKVFPEADFLIDLHSGDSDESMLPLAFFPTGESEELANKARDAASRTSLFLRVPSKAKDGLYGSAAHHGVPSLLLERGGLGRWSDEEVAADVDDVQKIMAHLGILRAPSPVNQTQREVKRTKYVTAPGQGMWIPAVREGESVKAYQKLGEIRSLEDKSVTAITALFDATVMYMSLALGVAEDDALIAYGA